MRIFLLGRVGARLLQKAPRMSRAALIIGLAMVPMIARADPARARSRTGHVAEIKAVAEGCEALLIDGREVWREAGPVQVTGAPRWSKSGHGVAFLVRAAGVTRLLVILISGEAAGNILSWSVPPRALPARHISWLGSRKLALGETELEPKLVVGWDVD
jgi:hypothetical protein